MFAGGGEFVADEAQLEQPAAEGVFRVVGYGAAWAGAGCGQRGVGYGHAELDVGFHLPRVECAPKASLMCSNT